jgi:hypothetical protein
MVPLVGEACVRGEDPLIIRRGQLIETGASKVVAQHSYISLFTFHCFFFPLTLSPSASL